MGRLSPNPPFKIGYDLPFVVVINVKVLGPILFYLFLIPSTCWLLILPAKNY